MLVRISYTRLGSLGSQFDEIQNRMTSHLQYETWAEFMVVWRGDRIELYKDYVRLNSFSVIIHRVDDDISSVAHTRKRVAFRA